MIFPTAVFYVFRDKNWIAKLIALFFSGLLIFIPYGYYLRVIQLVSSGEEGKLPEFNETGADFTKGVLAFIGWAIYLVPVVIVYVVVAQISDVLAIIVGIPFLIVATAGIQVAMIRFAVNGEFSAFFDFPTAFKVATSNLGIIILDNIQIFLVQALSLVIGFLLIWTVCGFYIFYLNMIVAGAYGAGIMARHLGIEWRGPGTKFDFAGTFK
jgi:hypothetical protein